ncbi:hypothetical protein DFJ73DRAFT_852722 [Zopfochytrium polystomum]|nr:hypothetical protein DFJ73DRAFT_852722 [Zopfochytrium polystomum]
MSEPVASPLTEPTTPVVANAPVDAATAEANHEAPAPAVDAEEPQTPLPADPPADPPAVAPAAPAPAAAAESTQGSLEARDASSFEPLLPPSAEPAKEPSQEQHVEGAAPPPAAPPPNPAKEGSPALPSETTIAAAPATAKPIAEAAGSPGALHADAVRLAIASVALTATSVDHTRKEDPSKPVDAATTEASGLRVPDQTAAPASRPASIAPSRSMPEPAKEYRLKRIDWARPGKQPMEVNIITQNENGPCPLLALCNVLLLRGDISISLDRSFVTYQHLVDLLGDYLLNRNVTPSNVHGANAEAVLNLSQNMQDVMDLFPSLQTGLDVNVHFDSPFAFEVTPSLLIFDLFGITLCHGWTVDPQDSETHRVVAQKLKSYNKVVESAISADLPSTTSSTEGARDALHEGLVSQTFLNTTASQLTYHGINSMVESLPRSSLSVLFRNNHFCTLFAHPTFGLLTLVTDQGLASASRSVVWETLSNVEGDSTFVDGLFRFSQPDPTPSSDNLVQLDSIDQEEQARAWEAAKAQAAGRAEPAVVPTYEDDLALARQLQMEEEQQAAQADARRQQSQQLQPYGYGQQPAQYQQGQPQQLYQQQAYQQQAYQQHGGQQPPRQQMLGPGRPVPPRGSSSRPAPVPAEKEKDSCVIS